ncbi:hypothetical protein [uncultured Ruminococcus sp.]|uniref:hypothetical protein n=1 Tax=uncultured Ruminococcus sp. TaxID=165186 RepID=UPI0025E0FF29|nr:hypothetical protein [uncultured Ruminococcus sp.]
MRLFSMLGEIYDDVVTGRNTYMYDDDYDCLYLPVSKEFVTHGLEKQCDDCGVLIFTMDHDFNYTLDSILIDQDEQPRDLREEIAEYTEHYELIEQYYELSSALSHVFCRIN